MDPKERFYRQFQASITSLQDEISLLGSVSSTGGERQDAIETILAGISRLSKEVSDASDSVPAYDQRLYSQALKALTDQLNEETSKLAPKSRFQFKSRGQNASLSRAKIDARVMQNRPDDIPSAPIQGETDLLGELPSLTGALPTISKNYNEEMAKGGSGIRKPSFSAARDIGIKDHTGLHIILPSTASRATSSGALKNLTGCIVDMSVPTAKGAPFASLALNSIDNSLIIAGHVDGPVHITGIRNSILVAAARQVRIHECENVDIYLHCASHPIIEDCAGMRFAPIPSCFMTGESAGANQWDQVDDFKWLKTEHSPNWKVLPEDERIVEDIWNNTIPGGPGVHVDDILKKVGIRKN